ncbi:MAG TPA: ankyrin repeat domain-containing protein [Bryobacteraceae bacterium]|jgi:ankyrin repeat protein|nr:ankyrin repeat domain-containing protein [Bryobacteraceae bacterium]
MNIFWRIQLRPFGFTKTLFCAVAFAGGLTAQAQTQAKIDFSRDVLPILRQNCVTCHGPTQQNSGMRVDRKSSMISRRGVVPGSAENSLLFHRITGTDYGAQMPPTGALKPEQIKTMKAWIDQGAEWPDSLANEAELPPVNPKAVAMVDMLHAGDLKGFLKTASDDPKLLNARGPEGSTPFMYAALYNGAPTLEQLLKQGADPNRKNDANVTALMWAATDPEKTRVLLAHGADVNARSSDMRTALMIAARKQGNIAAVKLLLDKGAKVNPNARPDAESSPLLEAATAGDPATMELLLSKGAETKISGQEVFEMAVTLQCAKCVSLVVAKNLDRDAYTHALATIAVLGDVSAVRIALDHGADVNAFDPLGRTPLMYAAASDLLPLDVVKLLIERGANVNAVNKDKNEGDSGLSVLDIAKLHGDTPVVAWLYKSGAKVGVVKTAALKSRRTNTIQSAVQSSLPLIQKADANFVPKAACASCHNNSFAAIAVGTARGRGFAVDEKTSAQQVQANIFGLVKLRDYLHQGFFTPVEDTFGQFVVGYMLVGLDAEHYKADLNTDAAAMYLKSHQAVDGHWPYPAADGRPPICSDYTGQTAISMRGLQLYAPKMDKAAYEQSVQLASTWLANVKAATNEDRSWRLIGLAWSGRDKAATQKAMQELLAVQRADGGWSDLETMQSSAYATGKSLVALQTAGMAATDPAYQRGVQFLLKTQQEDGSWFVKTRAMAIQPYFDAGFPHGYDQWISAAGTSWATVALSLASPAKAVVASR